MKKKPIHSLVMPIIDTWFLCFIKIVVFKTKLSVLFLQCSTTLALYIRLIYIDYTKLTHLEIWVSKIRTLVVHFYLGKDVQLNCSALLNEKDLIYWNVQKENGENPNVHEEKEIRIKYAYIIYDIYHSMYKYQCIIYTWYKNIQTPEEVWDVWVKCKL